MMRLNNLSRFNYTSTGLGVTGGTLLGPVQLHADPINPLEAVTVRYVENSILNHTSSVPHLSSSERSLLNGITVTSGEINSVQGLTNNLALQLNGRLRTTGGTITGALTLHADPTNRLHALTKRYVDAAILAQTHVQTGTIVSLPVDVTPVGYLRANGAIVSQSTFNELFTVIGHRFGSIPAPIAANVNGVRPGAGAPWARQFGFNSATELGAFTSAGTLPNMLALTSAIVTSSRVFLLAGYIGNAVTNTILGATINADGTLSAFTAVGTLPVNLHRSSAIVTSSRVFLLGGNNGSAAINTIFSAVIQTDGTLGAFTSVGTLPSNLSHSSVAVTQNRVFLLGGWNGSATINTIHSAVIQADGTLGAFTAVGTLPTVLAHSSVLVTTSRVFLFGGYTHASNTANIFSALINTDGTLGAFTVTGSLPSVQNNTPVIATSSRVFLLGGWNGSAATNTIFSAPLIGGSGLNDYSRFYNGSINTFNGAPLSGAIVVYTNNPDRNTLFALPDETLVEALSPGMNRFIRAS